ncbi:MAG: dTMP kinase [Candidatus Eremiobacteraeota bacterium]|nr:dTMP kinase [Candidatus Eremiobacteraeota bacterium]
MFITFEGIEGSGKSTLIGLVESGLRERGEDVLQTREPGGTPAGDAVRAIFLDPAMRIDPIAEVMLLNASRAQLCVDVIRPAVRAGRTVLCDRFYDATIAYQGYGRALEIDGLLQVCLVATGGLSPDLTVLLDLPAELSQERVVARARGGGHAIDRLEQESLDFHRRVRDGYLQLARRWSSRFVVLDATQPPQTLVPLVFAAIEHVRERIRLTIP